MDLALRTRGPLLNKALQLAQLRRIEKGNG